MSENDDRPHITPLDGVEFAHALAGMAAGFRTFYASLVEEGFTVEQAFKLTLTYVHGMAGGKLQQ